MRIEGVPGTATGAHAGWIKLLGFEMRGRSATARTGGITVALGDGSVRILAPRGSLRVPQFWLLTRTAPTRSVSGAPRVHDEGFTAEIEFTRVNRGGAEVRALRFLMHGVRTAHYECTAPPGSRTPLDIAVVTYARMTHPGASTPSLDITQQVRSYLQIYDYPGYYAQRFDGIDRGGGN